MNKNYKFFVIGFVVIFLIGCRPSYMEVDEHILQTKIYEPTTTKHQSLNQSTVLYLDHSTCVIDARNNSKIFGSLKGQLGLYTDTLCLIKGSVLEKTPNTNKSPTSTEVFNIINSISKDIPYTDIGKTVEEICNSNSQSILITDFEYFDKKGKIQDINPYSTDAFIKWLTKGYSIYIITEPYFEGKKHNKIRFYMIFTDDRLQAPISDNLLGEIQDLIRSGVCKLFKMTNSDISVDIPKSDMVNNNLSFKVKYINNFEFISIDDSWKDISEYVMKLDKYGQPILEEKPEPLISNIKFNHGNNYKIKDIEIIATNITGKYLSMDTISTEDLKIDINTIDTKDIDISSGFILDKEALKTNKINVMLTEKIFTKGYLHNKNYGGNLIRLDFVIKEVYLEPFMASNFEWISIYPKIGTATCVSKSIDNALRDVDVVPTNPKRRVIHTIFIKTELHKN